MGCVKCNIGKFDHFETPNRSLYVHLGSYEQEETCTLSAWDVVVDKAKNGTMAQFQAAFASAFGEAFSDMPDYESEGSPAVWVWDRLKAACSRP